MALDIATARGQKTLEQEFRAAELFERRYPKLTYCHTPKTTTAAIDAMLATLDALESKVVAVVETKCREMSQDEFRERFKSRWLVTDEKIEKGRRCADLLQVPYIGFLYLVPVDRLLVKRLYCPVNGWLVNIERERTATQATVNGGSANRLNAFIDMSKAEVI